MIKSKEIAGPSCLTSAQDDEPIFVLRANDEIAPLVVRFWATQYHKLKTRQPGGMTQKQAAKQIEAFQLADQMQRWRAKNGHRSPESVANAVSEAIGHPVESVERVLVDGKEIAEPQRVGDQVLSGCAVRAAIQREKVFAAADIRAPNSVVEAEQMLKLATAWFEANDPAKIPEAPSP